MFEEEDYNTSRVKLDKEFQESQACSIFELQVILTDKKNKMSKSQNIINNPVFSKTLEYTERFNKYGIVEDFDKGAQKALRIKNILGNANLDKDEHSVIINLLPMKVEEAFGLMPSLREKISEDEMQTCLDELIKQSKIN